MRALRIGSRSEVWDYVAPNEDCRNGRTDQGCNEPTDPLLNLFVLRPQNAHSAEYATYGLMASPIRIASNIAKLPGLLKKA